MATPTTHTATEPALLLARRACYRFVALALADPRTGTYCELADPTTRELITQAAEILRDEDGQWTKDPQNPLYFLIRELQVALPLYPQFGTEPNGFYIPPRWVPRGYLTQMFGPGVAHAIAQ